MKNMFGFRCVVLQKRMILSFMVVLILFGVGCKPVTNNVAVDIGSSVLLSEQERQEAINCVVENFSFKGCELTDVWYDEAYSNKQVSLRDSENSSQIIVLLSNFNTGSELAMNGNSFNADDTYINWNWVLARATADSPWEIIDYGY